MSLSAITNVTRCLLETQEAGLSDEHLSHMSMALDTACGVCASHGVEPNDHLMTALWHFSKAVHHHLGKRHELAKASYDIAHHHLQQPLAKMPTA